MFLAMGDAVKRIATYADLQAVPPHLVAELVDGELHTQSRPAPKHGVAHSRLMGWSNSRFDVGDGGPGGWWILLEPEIFFGSDVCVPDIAGWRKERMPRLKSSASFTIVPDWVCEVTSPATASFDRVKKMSVYARGGVKYAWLVSPIDRVLEAFELQNGAWMRVAAHGDDERARIVPFEEVELNLAWLWIDIED